MKKKTRKTAVGEVPVEIIKIIKERIWFIQSRTPHQDFLNMLCIGCYLLGWYDSMNIDK